MNYKHLIVLSLILPVSVIISCKKEDLIEAGVTEINITEDICLRQVYFLNDSTGFVCGGKKNLTGAIFRTTDKGHTWQKVYSTDKYSLYDIQFVDDSTGYAGGDSLTLFKTFNNGITWEQYDFPYLPWPQFINPSRGIFLINKDTCIIAGGEHYRKGIISITYDAGVSWKHTSYDNEWRSVCFINDTTGFIGGYGVLFKTTDAGNTFHRCNIRDDSFVSIYFTDNQTGYAAGYDGGIYKTTDAGDNWTEILISNSAFGKRLHFNKIKFFNNNIGFVVGNKGVILKTEDAGSSWQQLNIDTDRHFYSMEIFSDNKLLVTAENGRIYIVEM